MFDKRLYVPLGAAGLVYAAGYYGVKARSSQLFGRSVWRGPRGRHNIALTFDDGPSESTPRLLDYLDAHDIKATFFQCGANILRHRPIAREVVSRGHQLGNHTWSHPALPGKSLRFIRAEFAATQQIIEEQTGITPKIFRAPYGLRWWPLRLVQRELDLLGVMWTVIGNDWRWPANQIAHHVLDHAGPGGIICLHDGRDIQKAPDVTPMLEALKTIVPALLDRGLQFRTIDGLFNE